MKTRILFFLFGLLLLFAENSLAIGISATPAELRAEATAGTKVQVSLYVENSSPEVSLFEAYPEEFESFITLTPKKFFLNPREGKTILVEITPPAPGIFETNISLLVQAFGSNTLNLRGGIKVPLHIIAKESESRLAALLLITPPQRWLVAVLAAFFVFLAFSFRKKKTRWFSRAER
ncbi:MAG: hypothetical protein HYW80_00910 [Parcubacteria group bacterium]|nr:hypothetical protein [Parcubacteria group bacterium]